MADKTIWLKMNEGPEIFLKSLTDGIEQMHSTNEDPMKIINNINLMTGFYLQDRDPLIANQIN